MAKRSDKLFVGNLSFATSSKELASLFPGCSSAKIVSDRGKSRGYGFATYASSEEANAAMREMDGAIVDGRQLTVKMATMRGEKKQTKKMDWKEWAGPVEPVDLWKIALTSEVEEWRSANALLGSDLDKTDGFSHYSDHNMVTKVANMFFKDETRPLSLLLVKGDALSSVEWIDAEEMTDAQVAEATQSDSVDRVRVAKDGCLHVHAKRPWAFDIVVSRVFDLSRGDDGASFHFPSAFTERVSS